MNESLYERLDRCSRDLTGIKERMFGEVYRSIEADRLAEIAAAAGIDPDQPATRIVEELGCLLQRERDLTRELRRALKAANR